MLDVIYDPARLHALLVHFPIAIGVLALPLTFSLIFWHDSRRVKVIVIAILLAGTATAFAASTTGERAEAALDVDLTQQGIDALDAHEWWGSKIHFALGVVTLFSLLTFHISAGWRTGFAIIAFLCAIATFVMIGYVGHLGGELVYVHGAGVP